MVQQRDSFPSYHGANCRLKMGLADCMSKPRQRPKPPCKHDDEFIIPQINPIRESLHKLIEADLRKKGKKIHRRILQKSFDEMSHHLKTQCNRPTIAHKMKSACNCTTIANNTNISTKTSDKEKDQRMVPQPLDSSTIRKI